MVLLQNTKMSTLFTATNTSPTTGSAATQAKITPHKLRPTIPASSDAENRRKFLSKVLGGTFATAFVGVIGQHDTPVAVAADQGWGTRSFLWEHFFEPGLSPEDSIARIKNTADGMHSLRHMLETRAWRYVIFYIRLKEAYLKQDMKAALPLVPEARKKSYIDAANELIDNWAELDYYVRTPKIYESYLFYEKTLKSIDNLVALLA